MRDSFLEEAERIILLREGDKVLQMTVAEAVRRAETVAALKGNAHAQRNFLERDARYKKDSSRRSRPSKRRGDDIYRSVRRAWRDHPEKVSLIRRV